MGKAHKKRKEKVMKKMKKFFAMFLTLAMVLGMSLTSFAEEATTTVTVNGLHNANSKAGYIKIVEPDNTAASGWKLTDAVKDINLGMTLEQILAATGDTAGDGKINPNLTNLNFRDLTISTEDMTAASATGTVVFNDMGAGLYAIKAVDTTNEYRYGWMVAYVGYEDGVIQPETVNAKGAMNQISKEIADGTQSVSAGDEVQYTVKVGYPVFSTASVGRTFVITDTVEYGTFKADSLVVTGGLDKWGLTANSYAGTNTLILTLNANDYDSTLANQEIEITYTVVAGDDVSATNLLTNTVTSQVGENPPTQSIVVIPSVDVTVTKTNAEGEAITGTTATFELYKVVPAGTTGAVEVAIAQNQNVTAVLVDTQVTNVETGTATFTGLDATETEEPVYYVKETVAPEGYSVEPYAKPLTGAKVTAPENPTVSTETKIIDGVEVENVRVETTTYTATGFTAVGFGDGLNFHDSNLASLPSTGGIGTTIFTVGGCAIMIIAAGLYFSLRRKTVK